MVQQRGRYESFHEVCASSPGTVGNLRPLTMSKGIDALANDPLLTCPLKMLCFQLRIARALLS